MELFEKNKQLWLRLLKAAGCALGAFFFFKYIFVFIAPFFVGWLLSLLFHPFVSFLEKKLRINRGFGTVLAVIILILFFVVVVAGIWHKLYAEAVLFYQNLPGYISMLQDAIQKLSLKWDTLISLLPEAVQAFTGNLQEIIKGFLPALFQGTSNASFGILKAIPSSLMGLIMALISSYFFTKDKRIIDAFVSRHVPALFGQGVVRAKQDLKLTVVGYLKTQLILMGYTFAICLAGLWILRSPYAFLLSVITSVIDAVPFFGSGFILWPGALIFFITGDTTMAIGYLAIYLCVNLMRQIMQPKILGTQIGLHPLLTLIAMYIGLKCLGIFGMILGPLVAVLIQAAFQVGEKERRLKDLADQQ